MKLNIKKIIAFFTRNEDQEKITKIKGLFAYLFKRLKTLFIIKSLGIETLKARHTQFHGESWVILHYQRIIDPRQTPIPISTSSFVTPKTFQMHCLELSKNAKVISLDKLCKILEQGHEPEDGTVVLTFDGGFNDFFMNASQVLLENKLHATIALKTGYIGSKALLLSDQIATSIMLIASTKSKLELFKNIPDNFSNSIIQTLKDGIPTTKTIQSLISILMTCDKKVKSEILLSLGNQLKNLEIDIPPWQDFMTWQDVQYLRDLGFSFIDFLHTEATLAPLPREIISKELFESQKLFEINGIAYPPILSLPYGLFTTQNILDLEKEKITYCLGNHLSPYYRNQASSNTKVLKRITICDGNSFTKDLFFNQIWDIS